MRWLFLRGQIPQDRSPNEIKWDSLERCDDMWEHLFGALVYPGDDGTILYWGSTRAVRYRYNLNVRWVKKLKHYDGEPPDVIFARGGFKEYRTILKRYPDAYKIYYGANHGCVPKDGIAYDMILVDSPWQFTRVLEKGYKPHLLRKPAPPQFKPMSVGKVFDCCLVAVHPSDERKRVKWVYKTLPRDLSVLQIGNKPKDKPPSNVTVRKLAHVDVAVAINRCRCLIAPYTGEDSGPRAISEALACEVPVVAIEGVHTSYMVPKIPKAGFWDTVKWFVNNPNQSDIPRPCVALAEDEAKLIRRAIRNAR